MDKPILQVMPDNLISIPITQVHILDLPQLCPISGNPQRGSTLHIAYTATNKSLEVYSLQTYVYSYIGGKHWRGEFIRDMEQTIRAIALDCKEVLDVPVCVSANLLLDTQRMDLICEV